ncbi:DNA polymerase III subunit gamma/tau [Candidatus Fokinia solitaria]|nr:DNA polymerase III subunit gamma/tau [Candidatus Fokinia solitaria]
MSSNNSHIVLSRKYRPSRFLDVVGQDITIKVIRNAILLDRVPHAILLTGTRGIGKTTIARLIAKALNCTSLMDNGEGCGMCSNCVQIARMQHPDVMEIDAASNTSVNDVRDIIETAQYMPLHSRYKIFIIDEVHMVSNSGFNAILKTLEEPPSHVKFILATTEFRKIPETIISRCQRMHLRALSQFELTEYYINVLEREGCKVESGVVDMVAEAARGSIRDGLSILEQALTVALFNDRCSPVITLDDIESLLGKVSLLTIAEILRDVAYSDTHAALEKSRKLYDGGANEAKAILEAMLTVVYECIMQSDSLKESDSCLNILLKDSRVMDRAFLLKAWNLLIELQKQAKYTADITKMLEVVLVKMSYVGTFENTDKLMDVLKMIISDEIVQPSFISDGVNDTRTTEDFFYRIERLINDIIAKGRSELLYVVSNELKIADVDHEYCIIKANPISDEKKAYLISHLTEVTGKSWKLEFTTNAECFTYSELKKQRQDLTLKKMQDAPFIQSIRQFMSDFEVDRTIHDDKD